MIAVLFSLAHAGAESDRALIGQLDREVIALLQKVQRLEGDLASCGTSDDPGRIYPELVQVFAGSPVSVERSGATTRVTLPGELLFSGNGVGVREEAAFALDLLATALKLHPEVRAVVVGHTDGDPPAGAIRKLYPTNWELSSARAVAIARVLTEKFALPASHLTVAARADSEPVATGDTPEGRASNRRIVVHVIPAGAPLP